MRILLAAAAFSPHLSGVQRHAFNVARCLLDHREVSAVHLVVAPWQMELVQRSGLASSARLSLHVAAMQRGSLSRNRWYYRELPALAERVGADLAHLAYPVPVNARALPCPAVVSLHDLYPYETPANFGFPKVFFNRMVLQQCLRNVDAIACVSDSTLLQLGVHVPQLVRQKAVRIYNCAEPASACGTGSPFEGWQGEPFLLCVAQHRRNKNILFLLHVFTRLLSSGRIGPRMRLVIVGIQGPETRPILRTLRRAGLRHAVLLLQGLSEPDLQWCYEHCEAVVAPSTVEGFGLPVVEALQAGCRVVCSDIPAFREMGGGHCRYVRVDGRAEESFANAVLEALDERPPLPLPMPLLAAPVIAEQYVRLYRKLLTSAPATEDLQLSAALHAPEEDRPSL